MRRRSTVPADWSRVNNLLVMRLDNIGDVILAGPALRRLRTAFPHTRITLMASPAGAQAVPLLPWVDKVFIDRVLWQDLGSLAFDPQRECLLIRRLKSHAFDGAVIFTSFSQSPFPAGLACLLAGIPLRAGHSRENEPGIFTNLYQPPPDNMHQADRNLYLLRALGLSVNDSGLYIEIEEQIRRSAQKRIAALGLGKECPYLLIAPWASAQARTYHPDRMAEAASILARRLSIPVVVTGSLKDQARSFHIVSTIGKAAIDMVGRTTIPELAALVKNAALVLTNDTSVMHLADAVNTPEVVLYSGTELESQWQPRRTHHVLLRRPTSCSPCYAFRCPRNLECLDFQPEEVAEAGLGLLRSLSSVLR